MKTNNTGELIKKIRKESKLTQKEFAKKYNVSFQAVSKWENNQSIPDITLLKQICNDNNMSIDEILEGQKTIKKNNNKKIYIIISIVLFLIAILGIIFLIIKHTNNNFEFKTLTTSCNDFKITGSIAYNNQNSHLYISNITYCGGNDNETYKEIECSLIEKKDNTRNIISKCDNQNNKNTLLEDYLKNIEFNLDDFSSNCSTYDDESLYLEIKALNKDGKTNSYTIPLSLNSCKN